MSTSPSPSSCTSASRTGVRELPKRFASDSVRSRSPGPNSPERIASRSSSETRSELVGLGVIGEAALKECIQNHAEHPKASGSARILHSKRGTPRALSQAERAAGSVAMARPDGVGEAGCSPLPLVRMSWSWRQLVVAGAEQDEVVDARSRRPACDRHEVVCLELARGGAAGVLAVR